MRRLAVVFAALAMLAVSGGTPAGAEPRSVTFWHLSDLQEVEAERGNLARAATLLAEARRDTAEDSLLVVTGDFLSPSLLSGVTRGLHMVEALNAIGVTHAGFGNHEFDFGPAAAETALKASRFPWLGANVLDAESGAPFGGAQAGVLETRGGIRIGLFGLLTPTASVRSSPGEGVEIADPIETARREVARLRAEGAEIVVALTHQRITEDLALAKAVPGIDLILGGDEHVPLTVVQDTTLIHKSGAEGRWLGRITLTLTDPQGREGRAQVVPHWEMIPTFGVEPAAAVTRIADQHADKLKAQLAEPIGTTRTALTSRFAASRTGETALGNLIADAMRRTFARMERPVDVAVMNGGGIRGNRDYAAESTLTRGDVLAELPFNNLVVLLEATGADLRAALENGVSEVERSAGRFPHVSGLTFTYDPARPAGERVGEVVVGGHPLEAERTYLVATNSYLANGGDGYTMFRDLPRVVDEYAAPLLAGAVIEAIQAAGAVAPELEGRIRIAGTKE